MRAHMDEATELKVLADAIQQGAAIVTAQGEVRYANERLATGMLRLPRAQVLGAPIERLVEAEDRAALAACLSTGRQGSAQCELRLAGAEGTLHNVAVSVTSLGGGEAICLFSDLSLQKRHAAADERTRKFLGVLAHEFRGMLATIGYSVAYLKAAAPLDPKAREALEAIDRQTQRLSALVEDLRSVNPKE